jgi:hypothetical protein
MTVPKQTALNAAYDAWKVDVQNLQLSRQSQLQNAEMYVTPPLLIHVTQAWEESSRRILIVGQETLAWGWKPDDDSYSWNKPNFKTFEDFLTKAEGVNSMVHGYKIFNFAEKFTKNKFSPFWRTFRWFRTFNKDTAKDINSNVLWTNLFKMGLTPDGKNFGVINHTKKKKNRELRALFEKASELLIEEIRILKPHAVVFVTGPCYDDSLKNIFGNKIQFNKLNGYPERSVARLTHQEKHFEGIKFFRTYHPAYLLQYGKKKCGGLDPNGFIQQICKQL